MNVVENFKPKAFVQFSKNSVEVGELCSNSKLNHIILVYLALHRDDKPPKLTDGEGSSVAFLNDFELKGNSIAVDHVINYGSEDLLYRSTGLENFIILQRVLELLPKRSKQKTQLTQEDRISTLSASLRSIPGYSAVRRWPP